MQKISSKKIKEFQKKILDWYGINQRVLPWRQNRNPYHILVSEIMLQQTQVSRVIPKYEVWLKRFPSVEVLAQAKVSEVLRYWSGLGYNRRALNLKKTAEIIVKEYNGKFPQEEKLLLKLPGIGEYTARALLCFAFDQQVAVVDTNVRKVILTQFCHPGVAKTTIASTVESLALGDSIAQSTLSEAEGLQNNKFNDKKIKEIAEQLLPKGKAYEWNQALMDYASAVLKKEKIPIAQQSKFIGSHRYYRGQILKLLLQKKKIALKNLGNLIKKDYSSTDNEWLQKLVLELQKEGFIDVKKGFVTFLTD